jgi:hypothetical protein
MIQLNREERLIIASLRRLAKRWPESLWVFCGEGFCIMRCGPDGEHVEVNTGGLDPDMVVATVDIPCDGGAW